MKWLKNLFKAKEPIKNISVDIKEESTEREVRGECTLCRQEVYMDDRYSKQGGKLFHKKCWREAQKRVMGGDRSI